MEQVRRKGRWGITLLLFIVVSGTFCFLIYRGTNTIISARYVYREVLYNNEPAETKDILYNYHTYSEDNLEIMIHGKEKTAEEKPAERKQGEDKVNKSFIYHKVASGETLWKIAEKYSVPIRTLIEQNKIEDPDLIYSGDLLKVQTVL